MSSVIIGEKLFFFLVHGNRHLSIPGGVLGLSCLYETSFANESQIESLADTRHVYMKYD